MNKKSKIKSGLSISRRKFLPILGGSFSLPFLASSKANSLNKKPEQSYQTLLTADGKIVKVKSASINKSEILNKELSNKSLLKWLKKKDKDI